MQIPLLGFNLQKLLKQIIFVFSLINYATIGIYHITSQKNKVQFVIVTKKNLNDFNVNQ